MEKLRPFGDNPVILKDYVKSQKHAWGEACFIPSASDRYAVERVVQKFLQLQGSDVAGGVAYQALSTVAFSGVGKGLSAVSGWVGPALQGSKVAQSLANCRTICWAGGRSSRG